MKENHCAHLTNSEPPHALCYCDYKNSNILKWEFFKVSFDFNTVILHNHLNNVQYILSP